MPQLNKRGLSKHTAYPWGKYRQVAVFALIVAILISLSARDPISAFGQKSINIDSLRTDSTIHLSPLRDLQSDINAILDNPDFSNAVIGISVFSLETGKYLYRKNESKNFIPASVQKLVTTAAALQYLGPGYRFHTRLYLDGTISQSGEFLGNIIVRASGDPTLSTLYRSNPSAILDSWVSVLDSIGICTIRGNIIADDHIFDDNYYAPGWAIEDICYPWSAQINALSIYDNKIDIGVSPADSIGAPAKISIIPDNNYVRVINNVTTVSKRVPTEIIPIRNMGSNVIELKGVISKDSIPVTEYVSATVDNPSLFFLHLFRKKLDERNIRHRGALLDITDLNEKVNYTGLRNICTFTSEPVSEIIPVINKISHNLGSDMLMKTIAYEVAGNGSFGKGSEQLRTYLSRLGVSSDNISIVDGSGLSRLNLISPKTVVYMLSSVYRSDYRDVFINSLAQPGQEGTLKRRMTKSRAEKNVYAKSGSLNSVSTLCGYVRTRDGEMLAFAIMITNYTVPQSLAQNIQDLICMRLASFSRKGI